MKQELLLSRRWKAAQSPSAASPSYGSGASGVARGWLERLLHFVLPALCLACRAPLLAEKRPAAGEPALGLCADCRARLEEAPAGGCQTCGGPAGGGPTCAGCRAAPRSYRRLLCGWSYAAPMDAVIGGLKFRRLDYLGGQLGSELGGRFAAELAEVEVVTAVPLGAWRRLGRGFDQAEAIATALAAAGPSGLSFAPLLARRRATPPQSLAGAEERRRNLAGAFAPRAALAKKWRGCHILLVDDVITTGATLEAAAATLLEGGAGAVTALAAARTAPPAEPAPRARL